MQTEFSKLNSLHNFFTKRYSIIKLQFVFVKLFDNSIIIYGNWNASSVQQLFYNELFIGDVNKMFLYSA